MAQVCVLGTVPILLAHKIAVTRFLNQPINAIVMTWRNDLPPSNGTVLRDAWWRWHSVRLATGIVGLSLLIAATLVCA